MSEENLRRLIRYMGPINQLRQDLEQSIHLELYPGLGDISLRTYEGLRASVGRLVDDPFLDSLTIEVSADTSDKEKVTLVFIASGQLLAYVQSEIGMTSLGTQGSHIQTAPSIQINTANSNTTADVMDVVRRALGEDKDGD